MRTSRMPQFSKGKHNIFIAMRTLKTWPVMAISSVPQLIGTIVCRLKKIAIFFRRLNVSVSILYYGWWQDICPVGMRVYLQRFGIVIMLLSVPPINTTIIINHVHQSAISQIGRQSNFYEFDAVVSIYLSLVDSSMYERGRRCIFAEKKQFHRSSSRSLVLNDWRFARTNVK